jgi:hypothetical protein
MSRWDKSEFAIDGGTAVRRLATFFEAAKVPFHAWCVVEGINPLEEARMCAEVLQSGARSLTLDLEPKEKTHYWHGTSADALTFGRELRRLAPKAVISVAPDPRPWQLKEVPVAEFASFSNEIAPQSYWPLFNTAANHKLLKEYGTEVGPDGVTPEIVLDFSQRALKPFGLPIRPIGSGNAPIDGWGRFISHATSLGMPPVSVWRYGISDPQLWTMLKQTAPEPEPKPEPEYGPLTLQSLISRTWRKRKW